MGGNIFSNIRRIEYPDFTGDRAKYEALKHAELARKLQVQQALQQQAEFAHKQKEWQRDEDWQTALGSNPIVDPETGRVHTGTLSKLVGINAPKALALSKSIDDSYEAKLKADAAKQARLEKDQQIALHDIDSGMKIADPQKRLEYVMQNWERYRAINALTADEHEELARDGLTVPLHDRMATRLLGAEKFSEYQKKALEFEQAKKKADADDLTRPSETAAKITKNEFEQTKAASVDMYNATNKEEYEAAWNGLPERQRARFPKEFSPANRYKALGLGQTAAELAAQAQRAVPDTPDKVAAMRNDPKTPAEDKPRLRSTLDRMFKSRQATPRPPAGGADIPSLIEALKKDPSGYAGLGGDTKAQVYPSLVAAGVNVGKNPITPAIKGQVQGLKDLENAVDEYRAELDRVGPTFRPGKGAKLNTLYTNLMMKVKGPEMYALGVLAGPDMTVLGNALTPPDSAKANFALGTSGMKDQLSVFHALIASKRGVLKEMYGIGEEQPKAPAGGTPPPASAQPPAKPAPSPLLKPGSVIVRTPDGAFTFPNQAEADAFKKKAGL
jgi:hypothetical protein